MFIASISVLAFCVFYIVFFFIRAERFRRKMKVGDKCSFYIDCDRFKGRIAYLNDDVVVIKYIWGTMVRNKKEVYP